MREIIFRGKKTDDDEWVYGYLTFEDKYDNGEKIPYITPIDKDYLLCEVYENTIGEYSGLTDCKGNKIFEGDIVKSFLDDKHDPAFGVIKYGRYTDADSLSDYLGWYIKDHSYCYSIFAAEPYGIKLEVVENIYDNPELLEQNNNE